MPQQDSDTTRCSTTSQDTPAPSVDGFTYRITVEITLRNFTKAEAQAEGETDYDPRENEPVTTRWLGEQLAYVLESGEVDELIFAGSNAFQRVRAARVLSASRRRSVPPQPGRVSPGDTSNTDPSPQTTPPQSAES